MFQFNVSSNTFIQMQRPMLRSSIKVYQSTWPVGWSYAYSLLRSPHIMYLVLLCRIFMEAFKMIPMEYVSTVFVGNSDNTGVSCPALTSATKQQSEGDIISDLRRALIRQSANSCVGGAQVCRAFNNSLQNAPLNFTTLFLMQCAVIAVSTLGAGQRPPQSLVLCNCQTLCC